MEVLEEGTWCTGCDWYESDVEFVVLSSSGDKHLRCQGCGCVKEAHIDAQVVSKP